MKSFTMAWRNVWRNSRRTAAAVAATSLGLLAMIFYSGLVAGYLAGMERNVVDLETGDVQIFHPNFRETQSLHSLIEDPDRLLGELDAAGLAAAPRLLGSGLAAAGDSSAGVSLRGVDVERDATVSEVNVQLDRGSGSMPTRHTASSSGASWRECSASAWATSSSCSRKEPTTIRRCSLDTTWACPAACRSSRSSPGTSLPSSTPTTARD